MIIALTPEIEPLLQAKALRDGAEVNLLANSLFATTLQAEEQTETLNTCGVD